MGRLPEAVEGSEPDRPKALVGSRILLGALAVKRTIPRLPRPSPRARSSTAIIWGDKDTVTPLGQAEDLHSLIPAATFTLLPGLGRIPQIEDPDAFNRALVAQLIAMK